jgi:WD40 repeat protein
MPNGDAFFFAGGEPGVSGSFGVFERGAREDPNVHQIADDLIYDLAVSGSGIAVACSDGKVLLLPPGAYNQRWTTRHRHTAAARAVAFSPDGKWLASAGLDGVVLLSGVDAKPDEAPLELLDHTAGIECLVFSPDSKFLASGSIDSKVRLHDVGGKLIRTYSGLAMENEPVAGRVPSRVLSLAWREEVLLAGTSKGALYRLSQTDDTATKIEREGADPVYALAIGPERSVLLGGESRLWKLILGP